MNAAQTPWQQVSLPHVRARAAAGDPTRTGQPPEVAWYRTHVPAAALEATPERPRLYIPRWQTVGTVAIYAGEALVWQTRGSRVWNSFNRPVWIDLGGVLPPPGQPLTLHVRIASLSGLGSALSSLWAGPCEALEPSWRARSWLQTGLLAYTRGAFLIVGVFALGLWLLRRRRDETMYLWFALMAVAQSLSVVHYLVNNEGFGVPDAWFSWGVFVVGPLASMLATFYFLSVINRIRWRWAARGLMAYAGTIALITFPPLGSHLVQLLYVNNARIPPNSNVIFVFIIVFN